MIKALVSLDADLASSIALRYACQLANTIEMDLKTMHVEDAVQKGSPPGSGWVRRTWENAMLKSGEIEIAQLIQAEKLSYPALRAPKMVVGEREDEILHEIQKESYDLFIEGALHTFTAANFYNKIRSKLYRHTPCPVLMVKNLVKLEKMVIIFDEEAEFKRLVATFLKIFKKATIELDLMHYQFRESAGASPDNSEDADRILQNAREILMEAGWQTGQIRSFQGLPGEMGELFRDYGLVISSFRRMLAKKSLFAGIFKPNPVSDFALLAINTFKIKRGYYENPCSS